MNDDAGDDNRSTEIDPDLVARLRSAQSTALARKAVRQAFGTLVADDDSIASRLDAVALIQEECALLLLGVEERGVDQLLLAARRDGHAPRALAAALTQAGITREDTARPVAAVSDRVKDAERQRELTETNVAELLRRTHGHARVQLWRLLCLGYADLASRVWTRLDAADAADIEPPMMVLLMESLARLDDESSEMNSD